MRTIEAGRVGDWVVELMGDDELFGRMTKGTDTKHYTLPFNRSRFWVGVRGNEGRYVEKSHSDAVAIDGVMKWAKGQEAA